MRTNAEKIQAYRAQFAENATEAKRQMQWAGERFGVFAKLKALEKQRRYLAKRIIKLDPNFDGPEIFEL